MYKKKIRCSFKKRNKKKENEKKNNSIKQIKKITWLQACFLGDVRVIWCNSLGDSHSQIFVMNNVKIGLDYYLQITSHVSHAVTSCIHFTSYFLLNLVHEIVCEFSLFIQDYVFYGV